MDTSMGKHKLETCKWLKKENGTVLVFCSLYYHYRFHCRSIFHTRTKWFVVRLVFRLRPEERKRSSEEHPLFLHFARLKSVKHVDNLEPPLNARPLCIEEIKKGMLKEYDIKISFWNYTSSVFSHLVSPSLDLSELGENAVPCPHRVVIDPTLFLQTLDGSEVSHSLTLWTKMLNPYLSVATIEKATFTLSEDVKALPLPFPPEFDSIDVRSISCDSCGFTSLRNGNFPRFTTLRVLRFPYNKIGWIESEAFLVLPNLTHLNLAGNPLSGFPSAIFSMPRLFFLNFDHVSPPGNFFALLPKDVARTTPLKSVLNLQGTPLQYLPDDSFARFFPLVLKLRQCKIGKIYSGAFRGLTGLTTLDLSSNVIMKLDVGIFRDLKNLTTLILNENRVESVGESLFRSLRRLRVLHLSGNLIKQLPSGIFRNLKQLRRIDLSGNKLTFWKSDTFAALPRLRNLSLIDNLVAVLEQSMIRDVKHVRRVQLYENPFDCNSCHLPSMIDWVRKDAPVSEYDKYLCSFTKESQDRILLINATYRLDLCVVVPVNYLVHVGIPALALTFLLFLFSFAGYKYRWYVRYFVFYVRLRISNNDETKNPDSYLYDVFISYSFKDIEFAKKLVVKIEDDFGLRVCIDQRDFLAGNDITDNIVHSIDNSRKVVFVLSQNFVRSEFCKFEMKLAQHRLFETNNSLVLLKYGTIPDEIVSKKLRYLMKTRKYIEWHQAEDSAPLFWLRLNDALKRNVSSDNDQSFI
ncbi:toll-like receptor 13 [Centruroides sculpturatus]|uniref:toll-like receptor 13 n=1 Tax=Centruroides sculpturatus TaxID=218467 RepID=UPI000C6D4EC2|nr:toll-like receptor 13 [Centruroides sculpturatus]